MHKLDWNDLRFVLALADAGSLAGAARALRVNHTTVSRRLNVFQKRLGVRLFDRLPTGYVLTPSGEELASAAREVQGTVVNVERRLAGQDLRVTGMVRVTTTDTLAQSLVPTALAAFAALHPSVDLEITTGSAMVNLSKRDADVAIRPTHKPPANLMGRRIAKVAFAAYATPSYLAKVPRRDGWAWLLPDESLDATTIARWASRVLKQARVALRADSLTTLAHAASAGLGVAALPCYLGDTMPGLARARGLLDALATELWVLTHEDLQRTARVRALVDVVATHLARERDLFEGRSPRLTSASDRDQSVIPNKRKMPP